MRVIVRLRGLGGGPGGRLIVESNTGGALLEGEFELSLETDADYLDRDFVVFP